MGEGDEDVGEDDGGVGVDCGDDDGPGGVPAPPGEKGREAPFFFFFLDLLPRWEKGLPPGPWLPWRRRGEIPSEIGFVSLSLSVSVFPDSALSPFLKFPEILNSDWAEIWTHFYPDIGFFVVKEGHQLPYGVATRVRGVPRGVGRAPLPRASLGHRLAWIFLPKNHIYSKKISVIFYPVWTPFDWVF